MGEARISGGGRGRRGRGFREKGRLISEVQILSPLRFNIAFNYPTEASV